MHGCNIFLDNVVGVTYFYCSICAGLMNRPDRRMAPGMSEARA
jgi:hypothetical protein